MAEYSQSARVIITKADVEAVLEMGKYGAGEFNECLAVAHELQDADLLDRLGAACLERANVPTHLIPTLGRAAEAVVATYLLEARTLDEVDPALEQAIARLSRYKDPSHKARSAAIDEQLAWINAVRILLADNQAASMVKLCSQMREIGRPDLGIEAADRALKRQPRNPAALTTRAAAYLDLGEFRRALSDASKIWRTSPSSFVAPLYIRALVLFGEASQGIAIAEEAIERWPDNVKPTALALIKAASQAHDKDALAQAIELVASHPDPNKETVDPWVVRLAAEQLIRSGKVEEAEQVVNQLAHEDSVAEAEIRGLRRRIAACRRADQRNLLLSDERQGSTSKEAH